MSKQLEVKYKGDTLSGTLVKEDSKFITIKLKSGYNANLRKSDVKILSKKDVKSDVKKKAKPSKKEDLHTVTILHTGGTIASKVDYKTGAVSAKFTPDELLSLYPELNDVVNIDAKMIGNIFSGDMNFNHWNLIIDEIAKVVKTNTKGIIVSHGTDTLSYTAAALQYCLENLPIPVLLVGAQRSSDRPSSDAYSNLRAAVDFILENDNLEKVYRRVGVCMHSNSSDSDFTIFDSISLKKLHSSRRDAFKQINYLPVADIVRGEMAIIRNDLFTRETAGNFNPVKIDSKLKIGFFKSHPNLQPEEIEKLSIYDGVVIEGTGMGHLAVDEIDSHTKVNAKNLKALDKLSKKIPVVIATQCVYGEVNLNVYSYGRAISETKVLGNHMNLVSETLFSRMVYCLSKDKKKFEELWNQKLEGFEIRTVYDED